MKKTLIAGLLCAAAVALNGCSSMGYGPYDSSGRSGAGGSSDSDAINESYYTTSYNNEHRDPALHKQALNDTGRLHRARTP